MCLIYSQKASVTKRWCWSGGSVGFSCAMQSRTGWLLDHQEHKERKFYISILPAVLQPQGIHLHCCLFVSQREKRIYSQATGGIHEIMDMLGFSEHKTYFSGHWSVSVRNGKYTLPPSSYILLKILRHVIQHTCLRGKQPVSLLDSPALRVYRWVYISPTPLLALCGHQIIFTMTGNRTQWYLTTVRTS